MDIQRLRNLTTGKLHTEMSHVYLDLETITGDKGIMTHMIPMTLKSIRPWLLEHARDNRLWDGEYDPDHIGDYLLPESTEEERKTMLKARGDK